MYEPTPRSKDRTHVETPNRSTNRSNSRRHKDSSIRVQHPSGILRDSLRFFGIGPGEVAGSLYVPAEDACYPEGMKWCLSFLCVFALPTAALAEPGAIESSRLLIEALVRDARLPGLSVAVSIDGKLLWSEGFGYADLEQRVPVTPQSRFRIGSVSKTITASAIGLLLERERLDLDAPVQRYVRDFPRKSWPITVRQLAGHTAGIRHYRDDEFLSSRAYGSVSEALTVFANEPLQFREAPPTFTRRTAGRCQRGNRGRLGRGLRSVHAARRARTTRHDSHRRRASAGDHSASSAVSTNGARTASRATRRTSIRATSGPAADTSRRPRI